MANPIQTNGKTADEDASQEPEQEFLTFSLGGETYGTPILSVQEIIGYEVATPLPNTPKWMCGVINIRGVIIPVLDMRARFGMSDGTYDENSVVIINLVQDRVIGTVVDEVRDVMGFTESAIQSTPPVSGSTSNRFVSGLGRSGDSTVMLLNIDELLMDCIEAKVAA